MMTRYWLSSASFPSFQVIECRPTHFPRFECSVTTVDAGRRPSSFPFWGSTGHFASGRIEQRHLCFYKSQLENDRMRFNPAKMCVMLLRTAPLLPVPLTTGCKRSPPQQAGVTNSDGSITNPDGSVTYPAHTVPAPTPARNPDGAITNPDGSVTSPAGSNQASREGAPANAPAYAHPTQAPPPEAP